MQCGVSQFALSLAYNGDIIHLIASTVPVQLPAYFVLK